MKITKVEALTYQLPTIRKVSDGTQDAVVVKVVTDEGITGIGSAHSSPYVVKAIVEAPMSSTNASGLEQILVGENPLEIEKLWAKMYRRTVNFGRAGATIQAMSAVDIALWDIMGKAYNVPIYKLLGGGFRTQVKTYASAGMPYTPEEAANKAEDYVSRGFNAVKFGWGPIGQDAKKDVMLVKAIREAIGDDKDLMIDAGICWDATTAIQRAKEFEEYRIYFLEEPLNPDDIRGYKKLTQAANVRTAEGEMETTIDTIRRLIDAGIDVIQPDIGRIGGFTGIKKVIDLTQQEGVMCIPHSYSSSIIQAATLQALAAIRGDTFFEFSMSESLLLKNMLVEDFQQKAGIVQIPQDPGLGVTFNEESLKKFRYG